MKKYTILFVLFLFFSFSIHGQQTEIMLNSGWKAQMASKVQPDGTILTDSAFTPEGWLDAIVPGTILTTLLHNKLIPDPFFGLNNKQIPDVHDVGRDEYTYWFFNEFELPEMQNDSQIWLKFRGLNYFAEIFLNGHRVNTQTHEGMYLREKYNITPFVRKGHKNKLAVRIAPPNPVGDATRGQGGDGTIARNVTMQFTAGWDWICPIPDRNTGIWDQASVEITGPVDLQNPYIETSVPGIRVPGGQQSPAFVKASIEVKNTSKEIVRGKLVVEFDGKTYDSDVTLNPLEMRLISIPEITVNNPQLWWPNGMGKQPLYPISFSFVTNGRTSDSENAKIGIRETGNYFDTNIKAQVFTVNGQKVFIKGGNWIASDALLRLSKERYEAEIRLHAGMNMNMIRVWGGGLTERPEFYEACDKYGILVWQDLWITGDCNGEWKDPTKRDSQARRKAYPDNHPLFLESVTDQVKMLRNHPSLYLWCGGNETYPPKDILEALQNDILPKYDPKRFFLDKSTSPHLSTNTIGGVGDGPYGIREPEDIFKTRSFPFNPETGSIGIPNYEGLKKIVPENEMIPPIDSALTATWDYHKYLPLHNFPDRYGKVKDIRDFCFKTQIVQYEQYRALQEAFNYKMWDWYSGMLVWKNQNPWTALRRAFYDYYLDCNGGYFGYKHGAAPVHIQLNQNDSSICVLNQTAMDVFGAKATVELFDLHGRLISQRTHQMSIASGKVENIDQLNLPASKNIYFLRLRLEKDGSLIDENFYWLTNTPRSYEKLNELKTTHLTLKMDRKANETRHIIVSNPGRETAFFIRLKVLDENNELFLPAYFSENYFTLLPGEKRMIELDVDKSKAKNCKLAIEGWNVSEQSVKL